jgi:hypothetical protein
MKYDTLSIAIEVPEGWTKETALSQICQDHEKINFLCHNSNKYDFLDHMFDIDIDADTWNVVFYLDEINKAYYMLINGEYDV